MFLIAQKLVLVGLVASLFCGCLGQNLSLPIASKETEVRTLSALLVFGNQAPVASARKSFQAASKVLRKEFRVSFDGFHEIYLRRDPKEESPAQKIYSWKEYVKKSISKDYDVIFVFLPKEDLYAADGGLVLGYSQGIGIIGKIPNALAYSVVTGNDTWDSQVIVHELGHLLGANHTDHGVMKGTGWSPDLANSVKFIKNTREHRSEPEKESPFASFERSKYSGRK